MAKQKEAGTAVMSLRDQLKKQAEAGAAAAAQVSSGGAFFSLKSGVLSFGGNPLVGNHMPVVIAAWTIEHAYYEEEFDPDAPASPVCFAFGTDEKTMAPHPDSEKPQSKTCKTCPHDQFGSADKGKGKACKNNVRACCLPAGSFTKAGEYQAGDLERAVSGDPAYLRVPAMSMKGFGSWVTKLASTVGLPPHGVVCEVSVAPDARSQFRVSFDTIEELPDEALALVLPRHEELQASIGFPYAKNSEREEKPKGKSKRGRY